MSLKAKYDDVNNIKGNVVPLGHSEIKSILKSQSEAVFIEEKKMGPDKAVFIKKSLIPISVCASTTLLVYFLNNCDFMSELVSTL